ncbi:MAG: POTRA domain-containing protein [Candidatus Sulfotelmatobacter sp.]
MTTPASGFLTAGLLLGLLSLAPFSRAQSGAGNAHALPTAYKLIAVKVTGSKRFTQQEIATASGLPVGTVAHEEDFQKAARQLGESGAFSNIDYHYTYSGEGTTLSFQVADADKFVPARFTDFVWFSEPDLIHKLHERIPLFDGQLPTSGSLPGQVSNVLQAFLDENGAPGQVQYSGTRDKNGKLESIDYNVVGVSIRIHHADFPGSTPNELPLLQAAAEKLSGREYSREYMNNFTQHAILPIYREHGYLKASCGTAEPKVVKPEASDSNPNVQPPTFVDVTFPITPGAQYKVSGWQWSGNKVISSSELQPFIHAKAGQVANKVRLEDDLRAVQQLYGSRGYILASVKADAEFDDEAKTVTYRLAVDEGSLFHMGDLEFRGLDNELTARLRAAWKLRPGDVYDVTYLQDFLPLARKLLPPSLDWEVVSHVTAMTRDKTVDVDLQYTAKAPR